MQNIEMYENDYNEILKERKEGFKPEEVFKIMI